VLYLSDVSARNPLLRLTPDSLLTEALDMLFGGVHRIVIVDSTNKRKVVNMLCQTDLLKFLHLHSETIPLGKQLRSIRELGLGSQAERGFKLHTIQGSAKARDAFTIMRLTHTRALPILDEKGTLITQLSASDLSVIFTASPIAMEWLDLTALEYAKRVHELLTWVEPDDNAASVLSKMFKKNVHRVFITNTLTQLLGIITVTDMALMLC
jgi:CBS-domain-containing membrane protein